jgi:long-chain acyl-CoA synthetase
MSVPGVHSGERFTPYPEVFANAGRLARGFADLGVGPGDSIALLLRNDVAFIEASLATVVLGANAVPVNWHWRDEEVAYLLGDCEAKVLVGHDDLLGALTVPDGLEVLGVPVPPELRAAYRLTEVAPAEGHRYEDWLRDLEPWGEAPETAPLSVIYTSGTTGRPKGVVRTRQQDEGASQELRDFLAGIFGIREGGVTVVPAPMYHSAPNAFTLGAAVRMVDQTLMPRFDPEGLLRLIEERRVTAVQMVPTMFVRLLQLPEEVRTRYDLSSLEVVVHAAAPCPPAVKSAMIDWFGPIITEYYGSTETGPVVHCTSEEWLAHPGTVGKPVPGGEVRIYGDDGRELPAGESGDVYVQLDAVPDFTYRGDDAKRASIERDGLVTAGDVGYVDEDGFLYLNDRRNDMVISGGVNIYPAEIEACLHTLGGVRDCAVFGIPDERMGEAVAAFVEADPAAGLTTERVRAHVDEHLARYKVPSVVEFRDSLPREETGKVFKRLLKEPYWS